MAYNKRMIMAVDLRSNENNLAHRTREIDRDRLIVRRGQPFSITLQCSETLLPNYHLQLALHLGKRDNVVINVQEEHCAGDMWWFDKQNAQDEILLTLHSPADALIGHYQLAVLLRSPDGDILEKNDEIRFHLLFNPWCKDDVVYLPDESKLQEYIMNEDGIIYMGDYNYITTIPWNYGQFEDDVMDICFEILDNSNDALRNYEMHIKRRSDPVYIGRLITAMINAHDRERGVLIGKWEEPYTGGVAPLRWTGSVPILRQWSKTGHRAVKYGQCWVFAAVACTVLRCLGIPTRQISNFNSAHDTDGNLSYDFLLSENLEPLPKSDSCWNFHSWVESWMKRDDLPKGNDGWQVLDPTPQELSDGVYCCGPCPVKAIKEGNLGVKYDAPFVFAEVNADIVYWIIHRNGQRQKIRVDQSSVGKNISTKSVYNDRREDVTLQYKYPEGSAKEREVYHKAGRTISEPNTDTVEPGQLQMSIKHAQPIFGTDFDVVIMVENNGKENAEAQLTLLAAAVTYNSSNRREFLRQKVNITVAAHAVHREVLRVNYEDYYRCIYDHRLIRVQAFLEAPGLNEPIMTTATLPLSVPELDIQVVGKAILHQKMTAHISITNPLPVPLKDGVFTVEGAGLLSATEIWVKGIIDPGQKTSVSISFSPVRYGVRKLVADFDSDRLKDVKGVATVVVNRWKRECILPPFKYYCN